VREQPCLVILQRLADALTCLNRSPFVSLEATPDLHPDCLAGVALNLWKKGTTCIKAAISEKAHMVFPRGFLFGGEAIVPCATRILSTNKFIV
jgi:hypothetical protein